MDNAVTERIRNTLSLLNEKQRRLYLANEAKAIGRGGIKEAHEVSGVSRVRIIKWLKEIKEESYRPVEVTRCRKEGGGRKLIEKKKPEILEVLEGLLEPHTKSDPLNPLKRTDKSLRSLEKALKAGEQKRMGNHHQRPDRNAQFE